MLLRVNRLTKQKDFELIYKTGRSVHDKTLNIKIQNNQNTKNRYGIIISTKISKKSVVRNKLKRAIREIIKKEDKKLKQGLDIVIITRPEIMELTNNEIGQVLTKNLAKLKLYQAQ